MIEKRKPRIRKIKPFSTPEEAKAFAMIGPLPEKMPFTNWDMITQGIRLHDDGLHEDEYIGAMDLFKKTFK